MFHAISQTIIDGDVEKVAAHISIALDQGMSANEILDAIREGAQTVGQRYENGEIFLTDLMLAGATMQEALEALQPVMQKGGTAKLGIIVVGSAEGDLHDIGKNIFKSLALGTGFQVVDVGVDVNPAVFVENVTRSQARVVGISALLSTTMVNMRKVIDALVGASLRDKVKVILGGPAVSDQFATEVHADAGVNDAVQGVEICERWIRE